MGFFFCLVGFSYRFCILHAISLYVSLYTVCAIPDSATEISDVSVSGGLPFLAQAVTEMIEPGQYVKLDKNDTLKAQIYVVLLDFVRYTAEQSVSRARPALILYMYVCD